MTDYKKYINALRKCAKEHENDRTSFGHIIVSDLCRDTANLLESLEQEPCENCIQCRSDLEEIKEPMYDSAGNMIGYGVLMTWVRDLPSIQPTTKENLVVEDCISRAEAMMETMMFAGNVKSDEEDIYIKVSDAVQLLRELPPVTPKPKTDEPMQVDLEGDGYSDGELVYDYGKCPKCGWDFEYGDKDWEEPYCCHCGQKLHWFESGDEE